MFDTINQTLYSNKVYFGSLQVLEYIIFIIIIYKYNPFNIKTKHPFFTKFLTITVALIYVLLFNFLSENIIENGRGETGFLIKLLLTIGFFVLSAFITKKLVSYLFNHGFLSFIRYVIKYSSIIILLAIVYSVFGPKIKSLIGDDKKKKDIVSFIVNFIMYIPCLLLSLMDYIKYQYNITTKNVWLLLIGEIILIVLWFVIPLLLHKYSTKNGLQLLKEPQYLNKESSLGTFEQLYGENLPPEDSGEVGRAKFNYHYSLSAWFYLNPQPPNTSPAYNKYTNILTYGSKPAIEYNGQLNTLRVIVESEKDPGVKKRVVIYKTKKILYQRWNNIVINYDRGTMDVFVNGELVGSKESISPYMTYESITVGSVDGLNGGISNVMYFKDNLPKSYIENMYFALKGKDEPFL
jgi:hypothetical protein